jgi:hypothetical protein
MEASFDVFLGHASVDKAAGVRDFADRLEQHDLLVFVDERSIDEYDSITTEVENALAGSLAFVAWYSSVYPTRRACQLELRSAYVAAENARELLERVFVVNPEQGFAHIHPATLRDARIPTMDAAAEAVARRVEALRQRGADPLGSLTPHDAPPWVPGPRGLGSPRFVGRVAELWELHERLQAGRMSQISGTRREEVVLVGLGGSGKSLLAEEYAHSFGPAYPGGIYWLSAVGAAGDGESVLLGQLTVVAEALGDVKLDDNPEPRVLRHRLESALAKRERSLWLVDDLPEGLSAEQAKAWAAPHEQAATLLTTRSGAYSTFVKVELDMLDEQSACELLTSRLPPTSEEECHAACVIALEELARHAQALDVASSYIGERPGSDAYDEFLRRTREGSVVERLVHAAAAITEQLPNGHEASIVATYRAAIDGLDEPARDLLRAASELAPVPIELHLAAEITAEDEESADAAADRIDLALGQLMRASLARAAVSAGDRPAYLVHTLVGAVAQYVDPDPERSESFHAKAVTVLRDWLAARDDVHDLTHAAQLESHLTHARHIIAPLDQSADGTLAALAQQVATLDYARGEYTSARRICAQVLAARVQLLGEEHPYTLASKNNLAEILSAQGELTGARRLQEEVVAACLRLLGEDHPDTLTGKNNLAATRRAQGDLAGARRLHEEVLASRVRLQGDEDLDTLTAKHHLATTLWELGDLDGSGRLHETVLAARVRLLGDDDPETLASKNNLAATLHAQRNLEGARRLQEEVVATQLRVLGEEHPNTLVSKNNLAGTLVALGDPERARLLLEEVVPAQVQLLGNDHPNTLTSKNNLAEALRAQGDLPGARRLQEDVLAGRARALGDEHPDTLTSKQNLAGTLQAQGDLAGARRLQEDVLAGRARLFGEHPLTFASKAILAQTLLELGDLEAAWPLHQEILALLGALGDLTSARRLQEEVLAASVRLVGNEHPHTLSTKSDLALTLLALGDLDGARRLQEEVLAALVLVGNEAPNTLTARANLADTLRRQGDLMGAQRLLEEVVAAQVRVLGDEDVNTLNSKNTLAQTLRAQGDLSGARRLFEEVLATQVRVLGNDHPMTLVTKVNLAQTLREQRDLAGARHLQEDVVATWTRLAGNDHPSALNAKHDLAATLRAQGDLEGARRLLEEVVAAQERLLGPEHPDTLTTKTNLATTLREQGT